MCVQFERGIDFERYMEMKARRNEYELRVRYRRWVGGFVKLPRYHIIL